MRGRMSKRNTEVARGRIPDARVVGALRQQLLASNRGPERARAALLGREPRQQKKDDDRSLRTVVQRAGREEAAFLDLLKK